MATKLEHALALAKRGFRVFPVRENAKSPPLLNDWPNRATTDPETIQQYWLAMPNANIAIECSGMIVIDVDVAKGGHESFQRLDILHEFPKTLVTRTPSGGRHHFFRHPLPVGNSVGALGAGIDVRSAGGYVVAPGSETPAGVYSFDDATVPIADAPPWLVDRLGTPVEKTAVRVLVEEASAETLARAKDWLAGQPPAFQGLGGDAHTFKVVAGLRDLGVSAVQALELLQVWNGFCDPPWEQADLEAKVNNAFRYAQNEPGSKAVLPENFPVVAQSEQTLTSVNDEQLSTIPNSGTIVPKPSMPVLRLADFAASTSKAPGYLVKGVLQRRTYAELFGAPGEGKTFVALDLAYHVASGKPWMDRKVHAGPVLYLAYEGIGGLVKRAQALRQHYGQDDVPLYVTGAAYDLRSLPGRQALAGVLAQLPDKPILIVIDTLARALMGGDENSAQDVGAFNAAVAALIESTGACVLIIHHSGKNKNAGARGSSALLGAIDTELEVDGCQIWSRKQRDVELLDPIGFALNSVSVGMDEDGELLKSCVVLPATVSSVATEAGLKGNAKLAFDELALMSPSNTPVAIKKWKAACTEFLGVNVNKAFSAVQIKLRKMKMIEIVDEFNVRRVME